MKRGFTLVELSIVLVIIGLLIGGILVAQSMIGTAQIQGVVRQLGQYDVAISNFQTKFNGLPGDTSKFTHPAPTYEPDSGADNGKIAYYNEAGWVWYHLGLGVNLYNPATGAPYQPYDPASTTIVKEHCPVLNIRQDKTYIPCLVVSTRTTPHGHTINPNGINVYTYQGALPTNTVGTQRPLLSPKDVLAIDQKLDDGNANNGRIIADSTAPAVCADGAGVYNAADNGFICDIYVEVGVSTGLK